MSEEDRVFFRKYAIIIGLLAVMIVFFIFLARAIIGGDDGNIANAFENTAPVGKVRMADDEAPVQVAAVAPAATAKTGAADQGKQVYSGLCISCHGTGIPGIPQLGDKDAWTDRLAQGTDVLYDNAINGFTGSSGIPMLPRGGNASLSDDEVKAAVDYMIANSQ
ncbi:MAG: c-type cytochrome [Gammaproteobacteria bacterium]|nr:c-type cytochrome [Gammaproteobacteria bacterium]